jgi:Domain of unknown function (DUF4288)
MNMWYSAALLFERIHPTRTGRAKEPLWEESVILVDASSEEDAREKAEAFGKKEAISFQAISGERVEWRLVEVVDIHEIQDRDLKSGTEVFSRFLNDRPTKTRP